MSSQGLAQNVLYFKRFRMEIGLEQAPPVPALPEGYAWDAWDVNLLADHAEVKYLCFRGEIDATVFPNLGDRQGCLHLMTEIAQRAGFLPGATWLIRGPDGPCATVQGIGDRGGLGAIQNLGVVPAHRGRGLGTALLLKALDGFRRAGLPRAFLEVTAQNDGAVRMYRRLGFRCRKTIYKAVEVRGHPRLRKDADGLAGLR